jgi:deoxyadenosine/deoxycytidine kinase
MFFIEGNIGSGKSTLLNKLKEQINVQLEPLEKWCAVKDSSNKSIFQYFYEDQSRFSLCFQMLTLQTRIEDYENSTAKVFERSILSDFNIFARTLHMEGKMSEIEYKVFQRHYNQMLKMLDLSKIEGLIYLRVDPKICFERINTRNRSEENLIALEYLQKLHESHEDFISSYDGAVLIIDDNDDINLSKVLEFINST